MSDVAGVGETRFPTICGTCGENTRWIGKSRERREVCACTPPPAPKVKGRLNTAKKGRRLEVASRKALEALGVTRVVLQPGSGAYGTRNDVTFLQGDLSVQIAGVTLRIECKSRADDSGFKVIKDWMQGCDVLTIKQDRQPPMHVLSDEAYLHLMGSANAASIQGENQ
jgi:hypothetical protein